MTIKILQTQGMSNGTANAGVHKQKPNWRESFTVANTLGASTPARLSEARLRKVVDAAIDLLDDITYLLNHPLRPPSAARTQLLSTRAPFWHALNRLTEARVDAAEISELVELVCAVESAATPAIEAIKAWRSGL
jgi:hypothetical protein